MKRFILFICQWRGKHVLYIDRRETIFFTIFWNKYVYEPVLICGSELWQKLADMPVAMRNMYFLRKWKLLEKKT